VIFYINSKENGKDNEPLLSKDFIGFVFIEKNGKAYEVEIVDYH